MEFYGQYSQCRAFEKIRSVQHQTNIIPDLGTCDIVHWSAAPHYHIANWTGF